MKPKEVQAVSEVPIKMGNKRTPIGKFIHTTWTNMNIRCGKYRKHRTVSKCLSYENIQIEFSREEFKEYCLDNEIHILSLVRPSLDRIDPLKNYSLDNIQIIELLENMRKDSLTFKDGKGTCCRCGEIKDEHLFAKDKRAINGRATRCKACDNKRGKKKPVT